MPLLIFLLVHLKPGKEKKRKTETIGFRLVTSSPGLGDNALEFVDLSLGTAEGTELYENKHVSQTRYWIIAGGFRDALSSSRAYGHACP